MAWFVYILIAIEFIVAWPIAKLITLLLGEGTGTFYRRSELKALVDLQATSPEAAAEDSALSQDEVLIIKGALDAESKVAMDAMIPLGKTFMLDYDGVLDRNVMKQLMAKGYSHVPVYQGDLQNIRGEFVVKNLIIIDPDDHVPMSEALEKYGRPLHSIASSKPLLNILDEMMDGKYRMAAVYDASSIETTMTTTTSTVKATEGTSSQALSVPQTAGAGAGVAGAAPASPTLPTTTSSFNGKIIGVITLFNVLEVVLGEPIISADDVYANVKKKVNVGKAKLVRTLSHNPDAILANPGPGSINLPLHPTSPQPYISSAEDTPLLHGTDGNIA